MNCVNRFFSRRTSSLPSSDSRLRLPRIMAETTPAAPALRADGRKRNQLRPVRFQNHIAPHATGSTLIEWGNTRVICGVMIEETVPRWMKEQNVT
ncbi:MAG TPA: hypothetical protein VI454_00815, partial [Verrucomicrobiae bacterium]